eukprot:CAMPEP_0175763776 /NCGR_PEP_ID=MMETSP0097-20121207/67917_1 /TAXON_ID=311494 /ORGANISM="Alexandrium monilatum, Strain CCMP3105" /LENGTH=75 /DNA_ID=CAMNT_0017073527 /DNA_START=255 /DNA_END=479 /DNA_ORIENTATION=+
MTRLGTPGWSVATSSKSTYKRRSLPSYVAAMWCQLWSWKGQPVARSSLPHQKRLDVEPDGRAWVLCRSPVHDQAV